jgi:hypothetical protein
MLLSLRILPDRMEQKVTATMRKVLKVPLDRCTRAVIQQVNMKMKLLVVSGTIRSVMTY